jgi:hypothetical protein
MFELTDFNKVTPDHKPIKKTEEMEGKPILGYGAADEADFSYQKSKFEDGDVTSYFKSRRISRKWVYYWMILQGLLLVSQLILYGEVSGHTSMYKATVNSACNHNDEGTCKSRLWQVRHSQVHPVDATKFSDAVSFSFSASTWAPHELQVTVTTQPEELRVPFELMLKRHAGQNLTEQTHFDYRTTGVNPIFLNEANASHFLPLGVFKGFRFPQSASWEGTVRLARFPGGRDFSHSGMVYHRLRDKLKGVKIVVNEMIKMEMDLFKKVAPMCDLEPSWSNVVLRASTKEIGRLEWIRTCLGLSILASIIVSALVWTWYSGRLLGEGLKFHYLVAAKTVFQDVPLQALVLWYIFSWYEGAGGERCQLCMLDYKHCEHMNPFHFTNFLLVVTVLASAISNQFLFAVDQTQIKTEDDAGFVGFIRVGLACVMTLPFSTAMVAFNGSLIQVPGILHTIFLLPCFIGWVGFFSLICFPIASLVDDDHLLNH